MKGRPIDQLVYESIFQKPRQSDIPNFQTLLQRHLIPEVRMEVQSFYGHLDTEEAKYPGLDYCHPTHRIRLSRWSWHRRLFRAFDALRLTPNEIAGLTKWEGTKWAKERYERERGAPIPDTTADGLADWVEPEDRPSPASERPGSQEPEVHDAPEANTDETLAEESDEELESVGVDLNERLLERVALRDVLGDVTMPLDEEWEQWLKHAIETGELPLIADQIARSSDPQGSLTPDDIFPPRMVSAARNGDWHEIPDFLHDMIRQSLENERRDIQEPQASTESTGSSMRPLLISASASLPRGRLAMPPSFFNGQESRRTHSSLRLPVGDASSGSTADIRVQRTARSRA